MILATGTKLLDIKSEVYRPGGDLVETNNLSNISELYCGLVGVDTSFVAMCIYPHGSHVFMIARVNSTFLGRATHYRES